MFSFIKRNKETIKKQNSSSDLPNSSELESNSEATRIQESEIASNTGNEQVSHAQESVLIGGIIFAIAKNLAIPIRFIGVGESFDDLRPFQAKEFVSALLSRD